MSRAVVRLCAVLLALAPVVAAADHAAVTIENGSYATRCAEEDNVYVMLRGEGVTSFGISALHPPYIREVAVDSKAPDFTNCDMSGDPVHVAAPREATLFDDGRTKIVAFTFGSFWRPAVVPFAIGDRVEDGLHLIQVFRYLDGTPIEILVLYPPDGYWRAKPLPPEQLSDSAYGSSFLIGPIEPGERPYVALRTVRFDPAADRFEVTFARGGTATLAIDRVGRNAVAMAVRLAPALTGTGPFAALRSMFVAADNADVAEATWRRPDGGYETRPILELGRARAVAVRFGRTIKSTHNLSAPDMLFNGFQHDKPTAAPAAVD